MERYKVITLFGGYIGESTRSEIEYAKKKGKEIGYLESDNALEASDERQ